MDDKDLERIARETRALTIKAIKNAASGHPGGAMSLIEQLVILHCEIMRPQPFHPLAEGGDLFVLSKGHAFPAQAALWSVLGWIDEQEVLQLRKMGSSIQGHPSRQHQAMSIVSSGSLGQGFAISVGLALAFRRQGTGRKVFVSIGEGCLNEGITLEAMRIAAHYNLSNLVCLVDYNRKQSDRYSINFVNPETEFRAFGWSVTCCNGHDFAALRTALRLATEAERGPQCIVAHTVKGYPIKYMMDDLDGYHGSVTLSQADLDLALSQLEEHYA